MDMGVTAIASLVLVTAPLALLETEKSRRVSLREVGHLFVQCAPLFGALFLFNLIESMPKFVMEARWHTNISCTLMPCSFLRSYFAEHWIYL